MRRNAHYPITSIPLYHGTDGWSGLAILEKGELCWHPTRRRPWNEPGVTGRAYVTMNAAVAATYAFDANVGIPMELWAIRQWQERNPGGAMILQVQAPADADIWVDEDELAKVATGSEAPAWLRKLAQQSEHYADAEHFFGGAGARARLGKWLQVRLTDEQTMTVLKRAQAFAISGCLPVVAAWWLPFEHAADMRLTNSSTVFKYAVPV